MALGRGADVRLAEPVPPPAGSLRETSRHPRSIPSFRLHSHLLEVSGRIGIRGFVPSSSRIHEDPSLFITALPRSPESWVRWSPECS
jgi:hypothetical protein